jgi:hypothetical protein
MDIILILFDIIFVIVIIFLKSYLLRWLASNKNWESNLQKSILTNIYWILTMVGISIIFLITLPILLDLLIINSLLDDYFLFTFINLTFFALNFIIGYLLISYSYNGSRIDSFVISLILLITEKVFIMIIQALVILILGSYLSIYEGIYIFGPF